MPSTTRGPLPSGTYWRRRLAILSVALVLVLAFGKVLTHASDGSDDQAAQAGTTSSSFPPPGDHSSSASTKGAGKGTGKGRRAGRHASGSATPTPTPAPTAVPTPTPTPTPTLADPTGTCDNDDVYITPTVAAAVAGSPVTITLNLQSETSEACTWKVSPDTVTVKITAVPNTLDTLWTSQQCPKVVPTQDVVVRRAVATQVTMTWNSRRSAEYCGPGGWALPGTYDVYAAALGGEPTDVPFELTTPIAVQVTQTVTPTPTPTTPTPTPAPTTTGNGKGKHKSD